MEKKKNTIVDVARKLNVSTSTVSRALNGHHSISERTKLKVRKVAAELNYSPNNVAASLRRGKVNSIGVILPRINSTFMSNCIFGIESVTYPAGYNLIISCSNEDYKKEVQSIAALKASQVSGIILSLSNETKKTAHLSNIISQNIPLVMFDRIAELLNVDSVVNDDTKITVQAIEHLHAMGFRKIAIFSSPTHIYVYKNRMKGYLEALSSLGLTLNHNWIIENIQTKEQAQHSAEILFKAKDKPDAVFCTSDTIALGVIQTLKKLGIQIPQEVGVIGYSNDTFSELIQPTLTSIEQYPQEMGVNAAKLMLDIIGDKNWSMQVHKQIHIKPRLIIRDSSNRLLTE
ncbi:LacI family DNA-binding transcriptional regulator [Persicitalea jodogahamensis]|nr:LacI family DNA-binding transcriptional regulator [Persicitalea jodogahamensis]